MLPFLTNTSKTRKVTAKFCLDIFELGNDDYYSINEILFKLKFFKKLVISL